MMSLGAFDVDRRKMRERVVAIKSLKCINDVREMLKNGIPISEVARYIQEEAKELVDKKRDALGRALRTYLEDELPAMGVITHMQLPIPKSILKKVEQLERGTHTLTEINRLYKKLNERLDKMEAVEEHTQQIHPDVNPMYVLLLKYLVEKHRVEVDLGLAKPLPPGSAESDILDAEIIQRFGDSDVSEVLTNPESRRKILDMLQTATRGRIKRQKTEGNP